MIRKGWIRPAVLRTKSKRKAKSKKCLFAFQPQRIGRMSLQEARNRLAPSLSARLGDLEVAAIHASSPARLGGLLEVTFELYHSRLHSSGL